MDTNDDKNNDEILMQLISKGDENAFATLLQKHLQKTVGMAIRIVGSRAEAEDIAQEAFIRLWKYAPNWKTKEKGGAKFTTWFYRVVTNLCIDYTRKRKMVALDNIQEPKSEEIEVLTQMEQREKYDKLAEFVSLLPDRQRIALTLCFYEEMSNKEAAETMGVSIKSLESLLVRARRKLKDKVKKQRGMVSNG